MDATTYLPTIAWRTRIKYVIKLTDWTYKVTVKPIDINELGAEARQIGNYLKDFVGNTYSIINNDSTTITVQDDFQTGLGPQTGRYGIIYKSVGEGDAPYLAPIYYNYLDKSALDHSRRFELDILWQYSPKAKHEILTTGENIIEFSRPFKENIKYVLWAYTYTDEGYQVGHTIVSNNESGFIINVPRNCNIKYIATEER